MTISSADDRIFLRGLEIECIIGFIDWERRVKQTVVIDLELPNRTAFTAIRHILAAKPGAKLIGLTTFELDKSGAEALAAGVTAIVAKDRIDEELVSLIRHRVGPRG